jgi:molybdopterin synthase sulfur carrier subunit
MELPVDGIRTVADVWARVAPEQPLGGQVLMAVNMDYAQADQPVSDGDEVAFFPPVTGGAG